MLELGEIGIESAYRDRIVRLASVVAAPNGVTSAQLDALVSLVGGAPDTREALADLLKSAGVNVMPVTEADTDEDPPLTDAVEEPDIAERVTADFEDAVRAARSVLDSDRSRADRSAYILSAEEEVGLILLLRTGVSISSDLAESFITGLDRDSEPYAAFDALVAHNVRLVHSVVLAHLHRGLEHDDLFQHGALGLIRTIRKFDVTKGLKLSTYATWWIRQALTRAIADEGALIRIPVHVHEELQKIRKLIRINELKGVEAGTLEIALSIGLPVEKVEFYLRLSMVPASLDAVIGDDANLLDLIDPIQAVRPRTPEDFLQEWASGQWVQQQFAILTDREAEVLACRIGRWSGEPMTLEEIGKRFGVTRERIRQIEVKALDKLRVRNGVPVHGPKRRAAK